MGGVFDLVLGLAVQHVFGGDALDGQDDVTSAQIGRGRLAAGSHLTEKQLVTVGAALEGEGVSACSPPP